MRPRQSSPVLDAQRLQADFGQALALHKQGQFAEAERFYRHILRHQPKHFDTRKLLATVFAQTGRYREAVAEFEQALALNPQVASLHNNLGIAHKELQQYAQALHHYAQALVIDPAFHQAWFNQGVVLQTMGRLEEAITSYSQAIALRPDDGDAWLNRGNVQALLKQHAAALADYARAAELSPRAGETHFNIGNVHSEMGEHAQALASYERSIAANPDYPEAHYNRANILVKLGQFEQALAGYRQTLALRPDHAEAWFNSANVFHQTNRLDDALHAFDQALAIDPSHARARWNKSLVLLALGRYDEGWPAYEIRWQIGPQKDGLQEYTLPRWDGSQALQDKKILLVSEQGLGDVIQFARFALALLPLGAEVWLEAPAALQRLLTRLHPNIHVIQPGQRVAELDFFCPLMSLPLALGLHTPDALPAAPMPYLQADPAQRAHWHERLPSDGKPRIGLVWSGGFRAEQPEIWDVNQRRNLPLRELTPLGPLDVHWISLQKGDLAEAEYRERARQGWSGPRLTDWVSELHDFADTAALVANLDLVISVDTSTAHLAAALGRPVWLLNRFDTCWRWLLDRTDSPWYPSVRVYRQPAPGDWASVVAQVVQDLRTWTPTHGAHTQASAGKTTGTACPAG